LLKALRALAAFPIFWSAPGVGEAGAGLTVGWGEIGGVLLMLRAHIPKPAAHGAFPATADAEAAQMQPLFCILTAPRAKSDFSHMRSPNVEIDPFSSAVASSFEFGMLRISPLPPLLEKEGGPVDGIVPNLLEANHSGTLPPYCSSHSFQYWQYLLLHNG